MAKVIIDEATLTDIGDAIREKEGSTALIPTSNMASRIRAITGGIGSSVLEDALVTKEITTYSNDKITKIGWYSFAYCENLTSVSFQNVLEVGYEAFYGCSSLISVNLPNATSFENYVFLNCTALQSITLPKVTNAGSRAFYGCSALKTVRMPLVNFCHQYDFSGCTSLTDVYYGYTGVVPLDANTFAFSDCPTGVKIHVRSAYANSYKTATNWSKLISAGTVVIVGDYTD